jgi:tetratricopeptide (TPR) repeat protein
MSGPLVNVNVGATPLPKAYKAPPLQPVPFNSALTAAISQPFSEENERFALACDKCRGRDWDWIHQNADGLRTLRNLEGQTLLEHACRKGDFLFALCLLKIRSVEELVGRLKTNNAPEVCIESARRIVRHFFAISQPSAYDIQEVSTLALAQHSEISLSLLKHFGEQIKDKPFLDIHKLKAFRLILENIPVELLKGEKNLLFQAIKIIFSKLEEVCLQDINLTCELLKVLSDICDKAEEIEEIQLPREELHKPLYDKLKELKKEESALVVFDAAYALQSLVLIPDDESQAAAAFRHVKAALKSIFCIAQVIKTAKTGEADLGSALEALAEAKEAVTSNQRPKVWHVHAQFLRHLIRHELNEDNIDKFVEFVGSQEEIMTNRYVAGCILIFIDEAILEQNKNEKFWKQAIGLLKEMCLNEKWGSDRSCIKALLETLRKWTKISDPIVFKDVVLEKLVKLASHANDSLRNYVRQVLRDLTQVNKILMTSEAVDQLPIDPLLIDQESVSLFQEALSAQEVKHLLEGMQKEQQKAEAAFRAAFQGVDKKIDKLTAQLDPAIPPIRIDSPHPDFVGRKELLYDLSQMVPSNWEPRSPIIVRILIGPAGIGKSEICITFANRHLKEFSLIWFIRCESPEKYESDFRELAERLQLPTENESLDQLQKKVYDKLENFGAKPYLLAFDNVQKSLDLPKRGGCVLLNTCYPDIYGDRAAFLEVPPLTSKEAGLLCQKIQPQSLSSDQLERLQQKLKGSPILLSLAFHYLKDTGCSLDEYLQRFEQGSTLEESTERYKTSFKKAVTFSAQRLAQQDPLALNFLMLCSHLNYERIPLEYLEIWLKTQALSQPLNEVRNSLLKAFKNSSLIDYSSSQHRLFKMYRLTQMVLHKDKRAEEAFKGALETTIQACSSCDKDKPETWPKGEEASLQLAGLKASPCWERGDSVLKAELLTQVGDWLREIKEHPKAALSCYEEALKLREDIGDEAGSSRSYLKIAECLEKLDQNQEALSSYQRALEIYLKLHGRDHLDVAECCKSIGGIQKGLGLKEKSIESLQEALRIYQLHEPEHSDDVAKCYFDIGGIQSGILESMPEAIKSFGKALEIYTRLHGDQHPCVALIYKLRGLGRIFLSQSEEGLSDFRKALFAILNFQEESKHLKEKMAKELIDTLVKCLENDVGLWSKTAVQEIIELLEKQLGAEHALTLQFKQARKTKETIDQIVNQLHSIISTQTGITKTIKGAEDVINHQLEQAKEHKKLIDQTRDQLRSIISTQADAAKEIKDAQKAINQQIAQTKEQQEVLVDAADTLERQIEANNHQIEQNNKRKEETLKQIHSISKTMKQAQGLRDLLSDIASQLEESNKKQQEQTCIIL